MICSKARSLPDVKYIGSRSFLYLVAKKRRPDLPKGKRERRCLRCRIRFFDVRCFQYTSVNELELLATVDMAICDLRREGKEISVASIKDLIRSNKEWRDKLKKAYFKDADIQRAIKHCQELFPDKEG